MDDNQTNWQTAKSPEEEATDKIQSSLHLPLAVPLTTLTHQIACNTLRYNYNDICCWSGPAKKGVIRWV